MHYRWSVVSRALWGSRLWVACFSFGLNSSYELKKRKSHFLNHNSWNKPKKPANIQAAWFNLFWCFSLLLFCLVFIREQKNFNSFWRLKLHTEDISTERLRAIICPGTSKSEAWRNKYPSSILKSKEIVEFVYFSEVGISN